MKEILLKIFGAKSVEVGSDIANIIDRFVHTKEEKAELEQKLTEIFIQAEIEMQKNVTERWRADLQSDSWLAKNVRPIVLLFLIFCTMVMVFIDAGSINFNVKSNWVDLLQIVLITVISAYFGGRSIEKIRKGNS